MTIVLDIEGMRSTNCADIIEKKIKKLRGIQEVKVNSVTNKAHIIYDDNASLDIIINTVIKAGYYAYFENK